jgi:hypothetical protein
MDRQVKRAKTKDLIEVSKSNSNSIEHLKKELDNSDRYTTIVNPDNNVMKSNHTLDQDTKGEFDSVILCIDCGMMCKTSNKNEGTPSKIWCPHCEYIYFQGEE